MLLVGDHRQLSSVDAGGAFGLLATESGAVELTSLWRFRHPWEAAATRQLRVGDTAAIDTYAAHDRLHEGPVEVMAADAYRAWLHAVRAGQRALLIAADNATVAALNDQARADRIAGGEVEAGGVDAARRHHRRCRRHRRHPRQQPRRFAPPQGRGYATATCGPSHIAATTGR